MASAVLSLCQRPLHLLNIDVDDFLFDLKRNLDLSLDARSWDPKYIHKINDQV